MSLLVVITSYRAKGLTLDCLKSLEGEVKANPGMRVGICDNGNEDDTAQYLESAIRENGWQEWCYLRTVMPNRGFSGGNNVILREALTGGDVPAYFLLLNADTIVHPGTIRYLLEMADQKKKVGIFGPCLVDGNGVPQTSCFRFISPVSEMIRAAKSGPVTRLLSNWEVPMHPLPATAIEPDWVSFACALIRKEVFFDIGVLDEGYFLYFDDVDYCRSARKAGWGILHAPDVRVVHLEGQSNVVPEYAKKRKRRPAYWYVSRSWYFSKFYGKAGLVAANLMWIFGRAVSLLREMLGNKQPHVCEAEWLDNWKGLFLRVKPRVALTPN
ncbi:MAG: putative glycosyltransferase [Gallionellaceae bacterium]|nr:MAG: putative glycosyltransferase [Gallionellaceae bacterium]